jgi:hypothetical protein
MNPKLPMSYCSVGRRIPAPAFRYVVLCSRVTLRWAASNHMELD